MAEKKKVKQEKKKKRRHEKLAWQKNFLGSHEMQRVKAPSPFKKS